MKSVVKSYGNTGSKQESLKLLSFLNLIVLISNNVLVINECVLTCTVTVWVSYKISF